MSYEYSYVLLMCTIFCSLFSLVISYLVVHNMLTLYEIKITLKALLDKYEKPKTIKIDELENTDWTLINQNVLVRKMKE